MRFAVAFFLIAVFAACPLSRGLARLVCRFWCVPDYLLP